MRRGDSLSDEAPDEQVYWPLPSVRTTPGTRSADYGARVGVVQAYHQTLPADVRALFERVHEVALEEVPAAEQGTSYGMPALMLAGKGLVAVRATARHLSLYPFSGSVIEALGTDLNGLGSSKGAVRFTVERPLPDDLVRRIVRLRAAEISPPS